MNFYCINQYYPYRSGAWFGRIGKPLYLYITFIHEEQGENVKFCHSESKNKYVMSFKLDKTSFSFFILISM